MRRRAVLAGMAALAATPAEARSSPETYVEVKGPILLEGVAYDGRNVYAGAVAGRFLLVLFRRGRPNFVPLGEPLLGMFGMTFSGDRLWVATADLAQPGRSELLAIDTRRALITARLAPPPGHPTALFGDVAASPNGDIFVSDSKGGAILRLRSGDEALETLVPPGRLKSPQGMVVDGESLIVAEYSSGLHRVDLATGASVPIKGAEAPGIDGLVRWKDRLIAIQNGGAKPRILTITLRPAVIVSSYYEGEPLNEPTLGTIAGGKLIFIGRSQWGEADDKGRVNPGAGPTRVMSLTLPA